MTRTHRRWHWLIWLIVTPIVAAVLVLSLTGMAR
jgi:hypothetical protein